MTQTTSTSTTALTGLSIVAGRSVPGTTSVGTTAVERFLRPVAYQGVPEDLLPPALREANPWGLPRRVDGVHQPAPGADR